MRWGKNERERYFYGLSETVNSTLLYSIQVWMKRNWSLLILNVIVLYLYKYPNKFEVFVFSSLWRIKEEIAAMKTDGKGENREEKNNTEKYLALTLPPRHNEGKPNTPDYWFLYPSLISLYKHSITWFDCINGWRYCRSQPQWDNWTRCVHHRVEWSRLSRASQRSTTEWQNSEIRFSIDF